MEELYNTSISNKEALRDKIHEIHNYMRNHGIGYGMNALKTFNVLYGLKKIEDGGLIDICGLKRPYCEFSYMVQLAKKEKHEELTECILKHALDSLHNSKLRHLLFYEIPGNVKAYVFSWLIKEINHIGMIEKTYHVLLSGKIYEYFIGRDETAISELGAYFTNRHIVNFILNRLEPTIRKDGTIYTMIDMFGGSGGFTTGYVQYLQQKYPDKIDWNDEMQKIYHYDMNEDVVKSARLELFCMTGSIPNEPCLRFKNSFVDEFNYQKFHFILTNPPYGGDKQETSEAQIKQQKIKEFIKKELIECKDDEVRMRRLLQLKKLEEQEIIDKKQQDQLKVSRLTCSGRINRFIMENNISKANNKESCSLILMMELLDVGGTAVGVLKEGVFFDKNYKDIRRCLIQKFNVREIISVPMDQFENTLTKTSIIIFDNNDIDETNKIKFSNMMIERYTKDKFEELGGNIYLVENEGDIKNVYAEHICNVTREDVINNNKCSLNPKEYQNKNIIVREGFEMKCLGDICKFLPNSKRKATFGQTNGKYNFYTSSDIIKKCDVADYQEECIIIGTGGYANIKLDCRFSCSSHNFVLTCPYNFYVYFFLKANIELLEKGFIGSTKLRHLSKDYITNLKIPIPKSSIKLKYWTEKLSEPFYIIKTKREQMKELEKKVKDRILEIFKNEECEMINLEQICHINPDTFQSNQYPFINYIDIKSIKDEKIQNIKYLTGKYPSRAKRLFQKNDILYSTVRPNLKGYIYIYDEIENSVASTGFVVLRSKTYHPRYVYTLLKDAHITEFLSNKAIGSKYPSVNLDIFKTIQLSIPKNKQFIHDIEPIFSDMENIHNEIQLLDRQLKQYMKDLNQEAMLSF